MSETASTDGAEATSTESAEVAPVEVTTVEQLPEFAQKLISQLCQENANTRVKGKDAVEKTKLETTQEFEAALAESNTNHQATQAALDESSSKLAKLDAAIKAGIPTEMLAAVVSRLNGNTPEELAADVLEVKSLFKIGEPAPRTVVVDPSQGKGTAPETSNSSGDPFTDMVLGLWNESSNR